MIPDPDAIGSALALRELLGRNRTTTPIVTFGEVTRPENLAMIHHLEVQIDQIEPGDLHKDGAALAMVDVQPPYFTQPLGTVDLVVDHHPKRAAFKARFTDLRTPYGATVHHLHRVPARHWHGAVPKARHRTALWHKSRYLVSRTRQQATLI